MIKHIIDFIFGEKQFEGRVEINYMKEQGDVFSKEHTGIFQLYSRRRNRGFHFLDTGRTFNNPKKFKEYFSILQWVQEGDLDKLKESVGVKNYIKN